MLISVKKFEFWLSNFLLGLAMLILILVLLGDRSVPHVVSVNLPEKINPAEQRFIKVDFSRLMDRKSVEDNFQVKPDVSGKFSWSGKSVVFTLDESLSYGQTYWLEIGAAAKSQDGKDLMVDYRQTLRIDDLKMVYLSNSGRERGKIVVADVFGNVVKMFTDGRYKIDQFIVSPDKQKIYFLGALLKGQLELYEIDFQTGKIKQITNDANYLNKTFILSDDGKYMAMGRANVSPTDDLLNRVEVWVSGTDDFNFKKFKDGLAQGVDIAFSPGGEYLLYRNADSNFELSKTVVTDSAQDESLFIGEYSSNFGFHPYLPKIAFSQYDQQDVFSLNNDLILFSGDGDKKQVKLPKGVVRDLVFSQNGRFAVILFSREEDNLTTGDSLSETRLFHLYKYDFLTEELIPLTIEDGYSEISAELSLDSRFLIFERVLANEENLVDPAFRKVQENVGGKSIDSELWMMDLKTGQLENLKVDGKQAKFLP
jgi:hypothetical protein